MPHGFLIDFKRVVAKDAFPVGNPVSTLVGSKGSVTGLLVEQSAKCFWLSFRKIKCHCPCNSIRFGYLLLVLDIVLLLTTVKCLHDQKFCR